MESVIDAKVEKQVWGMDVSTYCMLMHLSQFLNYVLPLAGIVAPVVMWAVNKDDDAQIDAHGKIVLNWMLSSLVYFAVTFVLLFLLVGVPLMFVLGILCTVFPIIGALKAQKGQTWAYPMSIPFISVER